MSSLPRLLALVVPFALSSVAVGQTVHLVDVAGGGAPFTDIAPAIAAAADGDVVLVRPGTYSGFAIEDESLSVVADAAGQVSVVGPVEVRFLGAARTVVLDGLSIEPVVVFPATPTAPASLSVLANAGSVLIQDCTIRQTLFQGLTADASYGPGIRCLASDAVSLTRTTVAPNALALDGSVYGTGLVVTASSTVFALDCKLSAGDQDAADSPSVPFEGDTGVLVNDGAFLLLAGSTCTGGRGSMGSDASSPLACADGGAGGAGIRVVGSNPPTVVARDTVFVGGPGGAAAAGCGALSGPQGPSTEVSSGSLTELPGTARMLHAPSPIREGDAAAIAMTGEPGDLLWLIVSTSLAPSYWPDAGAQLLGSPFRAFPLGAIPASGTRTLSFDLGELGPGITAVNVYLQSLTFNPTDGLVFATGQAALLLDE